MLPYAKPLACGRCSDRDVETLQEKAAPVPAVQYNGHSELPIYERKSSFALGLNLSEPSPPPTDPWPWLPAGEGATWCKTEGRSDSYSLQITREEEGLSEWSMNREGDGAWLYDGPRRLAFESQYTSPRARSSVAEPT